MKNILKVENINIKNNRKIIIEYKIEGEWKNVFIEKEKFFIEYDIDIQKVPDSVKIIPFLCNILPVAFFYNATIKIESIDAEFFYCINNLLKAYQNMYPQINMSCDIDVDNIEKNLTEGVKKSAILFSRRSRFIFYIDSAY